jgi:hypothetical protein
MAILAGERPGTYEILKADRRGGMGEVYQVRDSRHGRTVAIKALHYHLAPRRAVRAGGAHRRRPESSSISGWRS